MMKCKLCGQTFAKEEYYRNGMFHIVDYHLGDLLSFVENRYMAKLFRHAIKRCFEET